jgi:putative transcriptional regulator
MINRSKLNDIERDLVEGMEGFLADLKSDTPIAEKYNCRRFVLDLEPTPYGPEEVKATRMLLKVSQSLFAQFLGVSVKTVCAWEQGKTPSDMACRFMDEIRRNPKYWRERLRESAKIKTG